MGIRDKQIVRYFERFDKHPILYSYLLIASYIFLNNSINASSVWIEHSRDGQPEFQLWEPYVWEYTSALAALVVLPAIFALFKRMPLSFENIPRQVLVHWVATVIFSLCHVLLMVGMRELAYWVMQSEYNFSPWLSELWYEYRKDAWGYVFWLIIYHVALALYRRLKGEASLLAGPTNSEQPLSTAPTGTPESTAPPEFLLVKKLDKEFVVKVAEIEWLESAGNYVNLHKEQRIYPLRGTLNDTLTRLSGAGFKRIHRSHGINLNYIDNIQYQSSGDGKVTLVTGAELPISRRYKDELKSSMV